MRLFIGILCLFAAPASAEECLDWSTLVSELSMYGETPFLRATEQRGHHLRFFTNPESGTWTIVRMMEGCWTIAGHGYGMEPIWSSRQPGEPS